MRSLPLNLCGVDVVVVAPPRAEIVPARLVPQPLPLPEGAGEAVDTADEQAVQLLHAITRALLEVLQARRPAAQLRVLCDDLAADHVASWGRRRSWEQISLAGIRANVVGGAVEGSARLAEPDGRSLALALRAERLEGRWRCTCFGLLLSPAQYALRAA